MLDSVRNKALNSSLWKQMMMLAVGNLAGYVFFRHLQTERSHLGGDILTIVSGVILNMSTHDSHTACVSDTR